MTILKKIILGILAMLGYYVLYISLTQLILKKLYSVNILEQSLPTNWGV